MNEPPLADGQGGSRDRSSLFQAPRSQLPASLPGPKPGPSLPCRGALGTALTFLDPTFHIRKTPKDARVKLIGLTKCLAQHPA